MALLSSGRREKEKGEGSEKGGKGEGKGRDGWKGGREIHKDKEKGSVW